MSGLININMLTPEEHQALACMFYAKLPKTDYRYKTRTECFRLFQKKFNKKINMMLYHKS